ncbi:MAG: hypothetical protein HWE15_04910 [Algoriphagus sp.]|uniref:hypothetical protein n=1 Tax=Algoriphagus sp. TaxID=1872435 RepID=UPI001817BB23|nr:hypothetical protein [Algoriphagus sp.]NVJ85622.1 hypothetical protein [Algoriphagus sp.]
MATCIICGEYTKFTGGLCISCYSKKNETHRAEENDNLEVEPKSGLPEDQKRYRYNMIKGRIAETLIQELFLSLNFNVFRFGMENTIPGIMELLKGVRTDVAHEIRRMPDFVMQNPVNKEVYFIEVKFRANGTFTKNDLPKNYPYANAYIILVSKKHIKCITVPELMDGKEINPESKNYLVSRKEFDLDKEVIIEFCKFATQFFESV